VVSFKKPLRKPSTQQRSQYTSESQLRQGVKYAQTLVHPAMIGISPTPRRVLILSTPPNDAGEPPQLHGNDIVEEVLKWDSVQDIFLLLQSSEPVLPGSSNDTVQRGDNATEVEIHRYYTSVGTKAAVDWLRKYHFGETSPLGRDLCLESATEDHLFDLILLDVSPQAWPWNIKDFVRPLACSLSSHGALGMYVGLAPVSGTAEFHPSSSSSLTSFQESLLRIEDLSFFFRHTRVYDVLLASPGRVAEGAQNELAAFAVGMIPMLSKDNRRNRTAAEYVAGYHAPGQAGFSRQDLETRIVPQVLRDVAGINDFDGKAARVNLKLNRHILPHRRRSMTYYNGHVHASFQHFSADWVSIYCAMPEIHLLRGEAVRTPTAAQRRRLCELPSRIDSIADDEQSLMELRLTEDGMASSGVYAKKVITKGTLFGLYDAATR
jgi:hypothetical protein